MNENTTIKEYHIICEKCKKYFFRISYELMINYFQSSAQIEDFLNHFHKKDWIMIVNLSVLSIFLMKENQNPRMINENEYDFCIHQAKSILMNKNLDYQDVWKQLEVSSIEDIILQKIFRIKNMKNLGEKQENLFPKIWDNYIDILNYSVLILIKNHQFEFGRRSH